MYEKQKYEFIKKRLNERVEKCVKWDDFLDGN